MINCRRLGLAMLCLLALGAASNAAIAGEVSDDLPPPPAPAPRPILADGAPLADDTPLPPVKRTVLIDEELTEDKSGDGERELEIVAEEPIITDDAAGEETKKNDDPCDFPAAALRPCDIVRSPCCPAPCCPPRLERKGGCCWPRDDCGWALGPCGKRIGRTAIVIEGTFSLFDDMSGLVGEAVPAGANGLSWDGNDYDPEFGGRLTLRHAITPRDTVEARAVWYGDFDAQSSQTGVIGFSPPVGGVAPAANATLVNESEAVSFEVNWWRELCCKGRWRWSAGLGMRYIGLDESARADFTTGAAAPVAAFASSEVDSNLIAAQFGAAAHWLISPRTELGLTGKLLLGSLYSGADVADNSVFVGGAHTSAATDTTFGLGAEFEIGLLHRFSRSFAITAGYTLLFVNDVVRANDAMDFSQATTGAVQAKLDRSELLIHTLTFGLQFNL